MTQARMLQPDRPLNASICPDLLDVPTGDSEIHSDVRSDIRSDLRDTIPKSRAKTHLSNRTHHRATTINTQSPHQFTEPVPGSVTDRTIDLGVKLPLQSLLHTVVNPDVNPESPSGETTIVMETETGRDAAKQPEAGLITTLDFTQLQPFQAIDHHFAALGVMFENAVALSPSNPAYPLRSGSLLVMDAPRSGLIEVKFVQPVQWISVFVTSSRALSVFARDPQGCTIVRSGLTCANLAGSESAIPANQQLILTAPAMASLSFFAFDGCVAIGEFAFAVTHTT